MDDDLKDLKKLKISENDFYKKGTRISKLHSGLTIDKSEQGTTESVLDGRTRMILFRMLNKGIFDDFRGCISTGKEANVYRAICEDGEQRAVKVYKTAVLAFKDRERYVTGEYRFRHGYSKHNHRLMVKLWAEKETRNLKRIYKSGIPVPKPLFLFSHILVMEFLGDEEGYASPRLRDALIEPEEFPYLYRQLLAYMRIMYQTCHLVHADLSEYNILYHQNKLWIIDVSQSVEHDHPSSLTFLRMDIKNVNDYFRRQAVDTLSEIQMFKFITGEVPGEQDTDSLIAHLSTMEPCKDADSAQSDAVFRDIYIPRSLDEVFDIDRDTDKVLMGDTDSLVYKDLLKVKQKQIEKEPKHEESGSEEEEEEDQSEYDSDNSEDDSDGDSDVADVWDDKFDEPRKFADREANKERKMQVKEERREKRANKKLRKKDKKRLVAKSKSRGKK